MDELAEEGTYQQLIDTAAYNKKTGVCYVPEAGDRQYTYQDFLEIAKGKEDLATIIFYLCEWQHPETIFDEMLREGEIDENGNALIL